MLFLASGLFMVIGFFFLPPAEAHRARLVFGLLLLLLAAAFGVEGFLGRKLLVTDDGLHRFRNWHRTVIPWSSVRSFTVKYVGSKSHLYLTFVTLDNGKQVPLGESSSKKERVERFAAELTALLREQAGLRP